MAEICCEEAKSAPSPAPAVTALARRRSRAEMAVAAEGFRPARDADQGGARGRKRRRVACAALRRAGAWVGSRWWPRYGVTSVCGARREMEDAVSIRPDFLTGPSGGGGGDGKHHFFGVFDGHGCSHVATMCKDRMHELIADEYTKAAGSVPSGATAEAEEPAWKEVMEKGFARMDDEAVNWAASRSGGDPACRCELQTPARCDLAGSTAVVSVVSPTHIVVANAGDSRAVLSRGGVPVPLSVDHKPDRPDELERIQAAGGRVIYWDGARVLGVLAMSRAIGERHALWFKTLLPPIVENTLCRSWDATLSSLQLQCAGDGHLKPFVTAEPEVTVTERTDADECLILASDGLWDVVTNEMACQVVSACFRSNGPPSPGSRPSDVLPAAAAEQEGRDGAAAVKDSDRACSDAALLLAKLALARRSSDNVSVVVVDLRRVPS